jgi:hypothetical protein
MSKSTILRRATWSALALIFVAFFVAGTRRVPFHGDESIWIYMSHDFEDLFVQRDASHLIYNENPIDPEDQSLRELNNPLAKYLISLSWRAAGYADSDLNGYWVWGAGWDWNAENGRIPSDGLLHASRWLPAALGALGTLAVMTLGVWLWDWRAGMLAAVLLATDASFLLHTRRAMAEGTLVASSTLSVTLTVAYLARRASGEPMSIRVRAAYLAGIGLLTGLAVATKLNGAIAAMVVAVAIIALIPWTSVGAPLRCAKEASHRHAVPLFTRTGVDLAIIASIAVVVVMALSPFLWANPLARVRDTLRDMNTLVEAQKEGRGWLDTPGKRVGALAEQVFWTQTAYYEDEIWNEWVGDQIARYEASPLSGWRRSPWARAALGAAFAVGLSWLTVQRPADYAQNVTRIAILLWLGVTALVNLLIIPFAWQRYYLTLWPCVALVEAVGLTAALDGMRRLWQSFRSQNAHVY